MIDRSIIGRSFAPVHARVEPGRLRYFLKTLDETNPAYRVDGFVPTEPVAATPIPPTYLFCLELMDATEPFQVLSAAGVDLARILHGEQRFVYHAPVAVGDSLTFEERVTSLTDKKAGAMTLMVVDTRVTNQKGVHVADMSRTIVVMNERPA